jgi:hypothetical protein
MHDVTRNIVVWNNKNKAVCGAVVGGFSFVLMPAMMRV